MNEIFDSFNPEDFLSLSWELYEIIHFFKTCDSCVNRTIYGRIYYAVFLFVREWLCENTEYVSYQPGEHSRMPNFIRSKGPFSKKLNNKLCENIVTLKKLRHQADYYLELPMDLVENDEWAFLSINSAFELAESIIDSFNSLNVEA